MTAEQSRFPFDDPLFVELSDLIEREGANAAALAVVPFNEAGRDMALDRQEAMPSNEEFLVAARAMARQIAQSEGTVTSPAVLAGLRVTGWADFMRTYEPRVMGVVFRDSKVWDRVGWLSGEQSPGSHARPVSVWRLRSV
jgi:hypothetical protein